MTVLLAHPEYAYDGKDQKNKKSWAALLESGEQLFNSWNESIPEIIRITREEVENLKAIAQDEYPLGDPDKDILYGAVAQSFSDDENFQLIENDIIGVISQNFEGNFKLFIGKKGAALKRTGTQARLEMEDFFQKKVFLQLYVKVDPDWRENRKELRKFGYEE